MARTRISVTVRGAREVERAFSRVPAQGREIMARYIDEAAEKLAKAVRAAASASSRQASLMAPTVKAVPGGRATVSAGGGIPVGRNHKPAFKVLFGSEFGAHIYKQFRPHLGNGSYWFFRTIETEKPLLDRELEGMADELVRRWSA